MFIDQTEDRFAVVDHLRVEECAGFAGNSFKESKYIFKDCTVSWAGVWSEACEAVVERLQPPHPSSIRHRYALERAIKWKLIVPLLFLRNPPSEGPSRAASLNPVVRRRFDM